MPSTYINLVQKLFDAVNSQDIVAVQGCLSADYLGENITLESTLEGQVAVKQALLSLFSAFPDIVFHTHSTTSGINSDGHPKVTLFWSMRATHLGTFHRIPATGLLVGTAGSSVFVFEEGQLRRGLHMWDLGGLLRSMRLLPNPSRTHPDSNAKTITAFFAA